MTRLTLGLGALLLTQGMTLAAGSIADGLYTSKWEVKGEARGQTVPRADAEGQYEILLIDQLATKFTDLSFVSTSNDNERYRLSLRTGPIREGSDKQNLALVIDGLGLMVHTHSERDADGFVSIMADCHGREAARRIAGTLGIGPVPRQHPGHVLDVTARALQPTHKPGEPVTIELTIKNVGKTTVRFYDGGQQRGSRNNQFSFIAFSNEGYGRALPDVGNAENHGGMARIITLEPDDVFTKQVDLTKWFNFTKPESYRITTVFELDLLNKNDRPIWDDLAAARCRIRIEGPEPDATKQSPANR